MGGLHACNNYDVANCHSEIVQLSSTSAHGAGCHNIRDTWPSHFLFRLASDVERARAIINIRRVMFILGARPSDKVCHSGRQAVDVTMHRDVPCMNISDCHSGTAGYSINGAQRCPNGRVCPSWRQRTMSRLSRSGNPVASVLGCLSERSCVRICVLTKESAATIAPRPSSMCPGRAPATIAIVIC